MTFGKRAFEKSDQTSEEVLRLLRNDHWQNKNINSFVLFWSDRLWLTINGMQQRIESVYSNVLVAANPNVKTIKKSLKTKNSRWTNNEINRIAPLIKRFLVRDNLQNHNQLNCHNSFQKKLGAIGPVLTIWCHYLIEPMAFPPIDKFNYTAWQFVTQMQEEIPMQVPNNFKYLPIADNNTNYQCFCKWFLEILNTWKNGNYSVRDVVNLDRSLMSLGAFIQKNYLRNV